MQVASAKKKTISAGDTVVVRNGDDKGAKGKVLMLDKKKQQVVVEGINIQTKHVKPMKEGESGRIQKKEAPVHISNVKLVMDVVPTAPP